MEKQKITIEKLKSSLDTCCINRGQHCIVNSKALQELLIDYMNTIQENQKLQEKLDMYKRHRDCNEEFEID